MDKLSTLLTGTGSLAIIETAPQVANLVPIDAPALVQTIIQLIVGFATLLAMFKRKKSVTI